MKQEGGWQFHVEIYKNYVIKRQKNRKEMSEAIKDYLKQFGDLKDLNHLIQSMVDDIKNSTRIIKNSNIPRELLAYPEFLKNGKIKQKRAIVLAEALKKLAKQKKIKESKKLIEESVKFLMELWKYGIHEKTFKFDTNLGIINKKIVLIDLFELTDNKKKVEKQIKKRSWDKPTKYRKIIEISDKLLPYLIKQANKNLTMQNLKKLWRCKCKK